MAETQTNWDELDMMWRERYQPATLTALTEMLLQQCEAAPDDYAALWRLARTYQFCGMVADEEGQNERAQQRFAAGAEVALRAVKAESTRVEGHFWYGVNSIEAARRRGLLMTLGTLSRATRYIERALDLDEAYHFAGPVRVSGRIMHFRPPILGGTIDRAIDIYHRALQIDDRNSTTLLYYAEALIVDQQRIKARSVLRTIIEAPDDPHWRWEQTRDRKKAGEWLERTEAE